MNCSEVSIQNKNIKLQWHMFKLMLTVLHLYLAIIKSINHEPFDSTQRYYIETSEEPYFRLAFVGGFFFFMLPRVINDLGYADEALFVPDSTHISGNTEYEIEFSEDVKMRGKTITNTNGDRVKLTAWSLKGKDQFFQIKSDDKCGTIGAFDNYVGGYEFVVADCMDSGAQKFNIRKANQKPLTKKDIIEHRRYMKR